MSETAWVRAMTYYAPTRGIVGILSLSLMLWGMWVANPFVTTFQNPVYDVMTVVATEIAWGVTFIFAGLNLLYGTVKGSAEAVRRGAFLGWMLWVLVSVMYGMAEPAATMVVTNFCLALMHGWVFIQAKIHPELLTGEITISDLKTYKKERNNNE